MQFRPGKAAPSFVDSCTKAMNVAILENLSDEVLIGGEPVQACFEIDAAEKFAFEQESPSQQSTTITLDWLKQDRPNVSAGEPVVFNGRQYKVKRGFPINLQDCWLHAELSDCGTCK